VAISRAPVASDSAGWGVATRGDAGAWEMELVEDCVK
jgi:hypothetical protein